jgi:hypothetical protein
MEKLFYSTKESIAFYIAGYVNTNNVNNMIRMLKDGKKTFITACNDKTISEDSVQSYEILKSSRYKSMRVFYALDVANPPKDAFQLGKDWTMDSWISS